VIFDIHALQERFYFGDNVIPVLQSGVPLLLRKLEQLALASKDQKFEWTIAFPDMGAYMRYNHMFSAFDTIICMKVHPRITEIPLFYLEKTTFQISTVLERKKFTAYCIFRCELEMSERSQSRRAVPRSPTHNTICVLCVLILHVSSYYYIY
jgi:hypothetical protein